MRGNPGYMREIMERIDGRILEPEKKQESIAEEIVRELKARRDRHRARQQLRDPITRDEHGNIIEP